MNECIFFTVNSVRSTFTVDQYETTDENQQWVFDVERIISQKKPSVCIDVPDSLTTAGTKPIVYDINYGINQLWLKELV